MPQSVTAGLLATLGLGFSFGNFFVLVRSLGAFVIGNDRKAVAMTWHSLPLPLLGSRHARALYLAWLALLFDLLGKVREEGLMSVEQDIEEPDAIRSCWKTRNWSSS